MKSSIAKIMLIGTLLFVLTLGLTACSSKEVEWNGETESYHVTMAYDETDMYVIAGTVDYIFVGTVDSVINNVVDYGESGEYSAYSAYRITVQENLKGELKDEIECYRHGGYLKDGTLLYAISDHTENTRDIPQEGKQYIFMAFGQPDGALILEEFVGDIEYTGGDMKQNYIDYIANAVQDSRTRFLSKYDVNYEG